MQNEKRNFQRIGINVSGQMVTSQCAPTRVVVLDVSLQGVRIIAPADVLTTPAAESVQLSFKANEDSPAITLTGKVTHFKPDGTSDHVEAGIKITHIPVDDLGALRRLLLLNSGQQDLDAVELEALVDKITAALS